MNIFSEVSEISKLREEKNDSKMDKYKLLVEKSKKARKHIKDVLESLLVNTEKVIAQEDALNSIIIRQLLVIFRAIRSEVMDYLKSCLTSPDENLWKKIEEHLRIADSFFKEYLEIEKNEMMEEAAMMLSNKDTRDKR